MTEDEQNEDKDLILVHRSILDIIENLQYKKNQLMVKNYDLMDKVQTLQFIIIVLSILTTGFSMYFFTL